MQASSSVTSTRIISRAAAPGSITPPHWPAFEKLGADLGVSAIEAAAGVHRVVNTQLAEGIRVVTVRRGVDPRRFALLGFGGAAGVHVTELARMLGIKRVIVPRVASVLSAWGMLTTELRLEAVQTSVGETDTLDVQALRALYAHMDEEGRGRMEHGSMAPIETPQFAEMRYGEQVFEIDVPLDGYRLCSAMTPIVSKLKSAFEKRHDELYAYALPEQHPVLVNARVATVGLLPKLEPEPIASASAPAVSLSRRNVFLSEWIEADVYNFADLVPGQIVRGPALIESESTTVVLRAGDLATTTKQRWLDIEITNVTNRNG